MASPFGLPVNLVWSNGDATVTVTPQGLLSGTAYELRITTAVVDTAGRHMSWLVLSTFATADVIPPGVIDVRRQAAAFRAGRRPIARSTR